MAVLREAGLVRDIRSGKNVYYELNTSVLEDVLAYLSGLGARRAGESGVKAWDA